MTTHGDTPAARSGTPTASAEPTAPDHSYPVRDAPAREASTEPEGAAEQSDTTDAVPDDAAPGVVGERADPDGLAADPDDHAPDPDGQAADPGGQAADPDDRTPDERAPADQAAGDGGALADALITLRQAVTSTAYPLDLPTAEEARQVGTALVSQLDDYLLPRLARLDAPLLVVVGGSTGAGKSTLVNSLVQAPVSTSGVLRPTTRAPVLVCHPNDSGWFQQGDLLPGLTRTARASSDPGTLQLVAAPALPAGLALLDTPDVDSVVDANRALAAQLLAAADLWLFVTTAARYADAVPWELLRTAKLRGTVTALVLDRVPPAAEAEVRDHLHQMLTVHGLENAPLFVVGETQVTGQGLLPDEAIGPLRQWIERLAADAAVRAAVVRQTVDGGLAALAPLVAGLSEAADEQLTAARTLAERVGAAYGSAMGTVEQGVRDGALLRGEVLARWQEFVGTGEFLRALQTRVGRVRDKVSAGLRGRPVPGSQLRTALESSVVTLIRGAAAEAAEAAYTSWQAHPAGRTLLRPELSDVSGDLAERAERLVRDWQREVLELVRTEGADRRVVARTAAYAVNASGLAVMIAVFASTAFIPTGLEVATAGGTTVAAQKVLEAVFGDQAVRTLAGKARTDLLARVDVLLEAEATRYLDLLSGVPVDENPGADLRAAGETVERARARAALTGGADLALVGMA